MPEPFLTAPIDSTSATALAGSNLKMSLVDTADRAAFAAWVSADNRGFHGGALSESVLAARMDGMAYRRTTGVYRDGPDAGDALEPVGTANSWIAELTIPGDRTVPAWAISSVTVAPTHRRRGIARALLGAELRTAAALGVPLAMLTVSESSIYGRFGFAPAALAADLLIDTRRTKWAGTRASGRAASGAAASGTVRFIPIDEFRAAIPAFHDRVRLGNPGEIDVGSQRWDQLVGIDTDEVERTKSLRAARYDDGDGVPQGYALYRVTGGDEDFTAHTLHVEFLSTATPDAYAGLWRYLLEVDLVSEVRAGLRSVDEPLRWQLSNWRAMTVTPRDHQYLRILDVQAALEARSYSADETIAFDVTDDLGITAGRYLLETDSGQAHVTHLTDEVPDAAAHVALTVNELSAIYLGGVLATTLVDAGRIIELRPGSAARIDGVFRSARTPWLSSWY